MPVESEIRARVEAFATDLVQLIKTSALDIVEGALGQPRDGRRRVAFGGAAVSASREKGAKRDPQVLEALVEKLGAFVIKNPGKRIEEIGSELAIATKELALPVKKLIAAKRIATKGQRRATTYYPAGGRAKATSEKGPVKAAGRKAKAAKKGRKTKSKAKTKAKAKAKGRAKAKSKAAPPRAKTKTKTKTKPRTKAAPQSRTKAAEPASARAAKSARPSSAKPPPTEVPAQGPEPIADAAPAAEA